VECWCREIPFSPEQLAHVPEELRGKACLCRSCAIGTGVSQQPAPHSAMQISGLHHVAIIGSDYAKSKHFYTQVLGLRVIEETYREARDSYKLDLEIPGGSRIELFSLPGSPPRPSYPEACGLRHLALAVAEIGTAIAELEAHGIVVEPVRVDELTGRRFTFFPDPDGLPIELYES